jgi:hypothetical protein
MNTLTSQDYLEDLQDHVCKLLPPEQTTTMMLPECQDSGSDELKDTQACENYLFSLFILFV